MNTDALVSIVIPTFNAEKFIRRCLEAALAQTYGNTEIIVIDDGSTDSTLDMCRIYAGRDKRIKLFHHANKGVSATRNMGMELAKGDYIAFFDADDYPEKDLVASYIRAYEEFGQEKIAFVMCGMFFDNTLNRNIDDKESILGASEGYVEGRNYILSRNYAATLSWLKLFNFVTNKCYDLNRIKEGNIRFDETIHIGEDLKFNLDYLDMYKGGFGMVDKALYHYVKHSNNSLSITYHDNDLTDTKDIYSRFLDWEASQEGVTEDNILVIKSMYITDWVSRMTTMYEKSKEDSSAGAVRKILKRELQSEEFKEMLSEVYKARKISTIRFLSLYVGRFEVFFFLRGIYQIYKG